MKKLALVITAAIISVFMLFSGGSLVEARIGVGVGTGKIVVTEALRPGQIYRLPSLTVLNTGDETALYRVSTAYHESQPELKPPAEWFSYNPNDFELKPTETKEVEVLVNIPLEAVPGKYFVYLEASPLKKSESGITSVSIAAAAKLYFEVEPANFVQGVYYRALSIWRINEPWSSRIAIGLGVVVTLILFKKYFNIEVNLKKKGN